MIVLVKTLTSIPDEKKHGGTDWWRLVYNCGQKNVHNQTDIQTPMIAI